MEANKVKKVLIALDYDPTSKLVAERGYNLAQTMNAEITLLHVTITSFLYTTIYPLMGEWQSDTMSSREIRHAGSRRFLEKAKRHLGDTSIQLIQKDGDFDRMILNTATEINADCIVIGSHSSKCAVENILMGSVTREVLRKTTIPLFVVTTRKRKT